MFLNRIRISGRISAVSQETTSYWISTLNGSVDDIGADIEVDSAGNIYQIGRTTSTVYGGQDWIVQKYSPEGDVVWQKIAGKASNDTGSGLALTASETSFFATGLISTAGGTQQLGIIEFSTADGTVLGQTRQAGGIGLNPTKVILDSASTLCVGGFVYNNDQNFFLTRMNSSTFASSWGRYVSNASATDACRDLTLLNNGDLFSVGKVGNDMVFFRTNVTTGAKVSGARLSPVTGSLTGNAVVNDSANNATYVCGSYTQPSDTESVGMLVKFTNNGGTYSFQRQLAGSGREYGTGVAVDNDGNVYVTGTTTSEGVGSTNTYIAKYNSSGTLLWQRVFSGQAGSITASQRIKVKGNTMYLTGYTNSGFANYATLLVKLPTDGTLTGTYSGFTYAESTLTDSTPTLTYTGTQTDTYTTVAVSAGDVAPSISNSSLTANKITI